VGDPHVLPIVRSTACCQINDFDPANLPSRSLNWSGSETSAGN
jgi:hypothetical protein